MPDRMLGFAELQSHSLERLENPLQGSSKDLLRALRNQLTGASDARVLSTPVCDILKHLQLAAEPALAKELPEPLRRGAFVITGGKKNQERSVDLAHFKRQDEAWFDFSIVGCEEAGTVRVLAYDFEIRFPVGHGAPFFRFDLNLPDHRNQERELRCHLHAGSDDILVPAPPMTPTELLALCIHGIHPSASRTPRTRTPFEREWFARSAHLLSSDRVNSLDS